MRFRHGRARRDEPGLQYLSGVPSHSERPRLRFGVSRKHRERQLWIGHAEHFGTPCIGVATLRGVSLDVRKLRTDEHRLAAGLTARAFRDNPTSVAMFGDDPLERLFRMQLLWTAFFRKPPVATRGVFYKGCL